MMLSGSSEESLRHRVQDLIMNDHLNNPKFDICARCFYRFPASYRRCCIIDSGFTGFMCDQCDKWVQCVCHKSEKNIFNPIINRL